MDRDGRAQIGKRACKHQRGRDCTIRVRGWNVNCLMFGGDRERGSETGEMTGNTDKPGAQRSGAPDVCLAHAEAVGQRRALDGSGAPLRCARGLSDAVMLQSQTGHARPPGNSNHEPRPTYTTEKLLRLPGLAWV
jgi:hypothetical protein